MMHMIGTLIIGFIAGVIAKLLHPGKENMGFIATTALGIIGSFVAAIVGRGLGWYQPDQPAGFVASVLAAVAVLYVYTRIKTNNNQDNNPPS